MKGLLLSKRKRFEGWFQIRNKINIGEYGVQVKILLMTPFLRTLKRLTELGWSRLETSTLVLVGVGFTSSSTPSSPYTHLLRLQMIRHLAIEPIRLLGIIPIVYSQ